MAAADDNPVLFHPLCSLKDSLMHLDACLLFSVRIWDSFSLYCLFDWNTATLFLKASLSEWSGEMELKCTHRHSNTNCSNSEKKKNSKNTSYSLEWGKHFSCVFICQQKRDLCCFTRADIPTGGSRRDTRFHIFSIDGEVTSLLTLPTESLIYASFSFKSHGYHICEGSRQVTFWTKWVGGWIQSWPGCKKHLARQLWGRHLKEQ